MRNSMGGNIAEFLRQAMLMMACGVFLASAGYAQSGGGSGSSAGSCAVTQLRLRFATSNDDLRGGQDNLNIAVYFAGGGYQFAPNVNHSQNWPNNSVNMVVIPLNRPVPPNKIRALRLVHIADGGFNIRNLPELATPAAPIAIAQAFQSPDNWNMADMEVAAIGNGVSARIANYGFHRFTGSNPDLIIPVHVPANICGSGRPSANSGGGSGAGGGSVSSSGRSGMILAPRPQQGMLASQPKSSALLQGSRAANKVTPAPNSPNTKGTIGDGNRSSGIAGSVSAGTGGPNTGTGIVPGKKLTNEDVVTMLGQGVQEQTILQRIQSSPSAFDVSNGARAAFDRECLARKPANESAGRWAVEVRKIWDTMTNVVICQETNGRGGEEACEPNSAPPAPKGRTPAVLGGAAGTSAGIGDGNRKADELSPQPYPPKGTLLTSGAQQTMLGTQANSPSGNGSKSALVPVVQRPAVTDGTKQGTTAMSPTAAERNGSLSDGSVRPAAGGTIGPSQTMSAQGNAGSKTGPAPIPLKGNGRTEYERITTQRGVTQDKNFENWANSVRAPGKGSSVGQQAGTTALATRAGSSLAAMGQVPSQVNLQVASACAKDPSFRILSVSGTSDGKTLTVGPQYTIWGCSFGNMPMLKRPVPPVSSPTQNQTASYPSNYNIAVWTSQPFIIVDTNALSWSDNAIVVSFPPRPANHSGPSTAGLVLPAQVLVTRGDGQTRIYGDEGGVYFRLVN